MIYIIIAVSIFLGDCFIKKYIEDNKEYGKNEEILNGNIIINKYHNKGAMLNFLENKKDIVIGVSGALLGVIMIIFSLLIPRKGHKLTKIGLSFIIGGAASNFYDRVKRGYVVDYFSFKKLKKIVFNISDLFIFLGTFIIGLLTALKK